MRFYGATKVAGRGLLAVAIVAGSVLGGAELASAAGTSPTATALSTNHNNTKAGQTTPVVTYTAVVTATAVTPTAPAGAPTGTMAFKDGTTDISGCSAVNLSPNTATRKSTATCTPPA
ncbi:MAG TPA: hypothetical protein VHW47_06480, partial [Acidimicrobiales bacterium]|nr:hypothetical protein [Acidimicrobiales bacterium]